MDEQTPEKLPRHLEVKQREILDAFNKNNELFEKQHIYLTAGAIALSFVVLDKLGFNASAIIYKGLLVIGWILLVLVLLITVIMYPIAARIHLKTFDEIANGSYTIIKEKARYNFMFGVNISLYILSAIGIVCIVIFACLNLYTAYC